MSFIDYHYLIEESLNEVYIFDADTLKFINVNRIARESLGYTMDELHEMTPLDIKPDYTSLSFTERLEPLRTGREKKIVFWTVHRRRNGTTYPIEVHLQIETFEDRRVFVAIILDITELKRIERYNIGLNRIFNDSLNEIYIFDAVTLKFTEVNQGALQNIGYTLDELYEMTPLDVKPEMTPESFSALIMPLRLGRNPKIEFTTIHRRKDGTDYPVEVHLQLSTFNDQAVFVAIILDITERQISERAKLDFAMKSERMRILKEFINDISHDFRTPMSVLNTKLYLLRRAIMDTSLHHHLDIMELQVSRLETLIDGLLRLAELDARDKIYASGIHVWTFIGQIRQDIMDKFPDKSHHVSIDIDATVSHVEADEELLGLALQHILKNAFEYTPDNGHIEINAYLEGDQLHIDTHDNGIGIPESEHHRIFERLYRIEPSRNNQTGGAGLGLAIAQRIVELHKGTIIVKSTVGEGTCFCLRIPLEQSREGSSPKFMLSV